MTLHSFLTYIGFSNEKPQNVSEARWRGMLKWLDMRVELGEEFIF